MDNNTVPSFSIPLLCVAKHKHFHSTSTSLLDGNRLKQLGAGVHVAFHCNTRQLYREYNSFRHIPSLCCCEPLKTFVLPHEELFGNCRNYLKGPSDAVHKREKTINHLLLTGRKFARSYF